MIKLNIEKQGEFQPKDILSGTRRPGLESLKRELRIFFGFPRTNEEIEEVIRIQENVREALRSDPGGPRFWG